MFCMPVMHSQAPEAQTEEGSQSCAPVLVLVLLFRFCLSLPPNHLLDDVTDFTAPQIPSQQLPIPYHTNRRMFSYRAPMGANYIYLLSLHPSERITEL